MKGKRLIYAYSSVRYLITLAGTPTDIELACIGPLTRDFAPITAPSSIIEPFNTVTFAPSQQSLPMTTGETELS